MKSIMVTERCRTRGDEATRVRAWASRSRQETQRPFIWFILQASCLHIDWKRIVRTENTFFRSSHFPSSGFVDSFEADWIFFHPTSLWSQMRGPSSQLQPAESHGPFLNILKFHLIRFSFALNDFDFDFILIDVEVQRKDGSKSAQSTAVPHNQA